MQILIGFMTISLQKQSASSRIVPKHNKQTETIQEPQTENSGGGRKSNLKMVYEMIYVFRLFA